MAFRNTISHRLCFDRISGRTKISEYDLSVEQCLRLLILTSKGELLGDPNYGTNTIKYLCEPNTDLIAELVSTDILNAVRTYEQRVVITENDITFEFSATTMYIHIKYLLVITNEIKEFDLAIARRDFNAE